MDRDHALGIFTLEFGVLLRVGFAIVKPHVKPWDAIAIDFDVSGHRAADFVDAVPNAAAS